MRGKLRTLITGLAFVAATSAQAKSAIADAELAGGGPIGAMPGVLQCVPFARNTSGIRLYGDAHTWWRQAEGKYARGRAPKPGAVMAISPHGGSSLGHVATVSRVIDARTILISHANWSAPGKIERNVTATDVSPANDWSEVRVWYAPIGNLGGSHWPVAGFIYNAKPGFGAKTSVGSKPGFNGRAGLGSKNGVVAKPSLSVGGSATLTRFVPSKTVKVRFSVDPLIAAGSARRVAPVRAATKTRVAPVRLAKLDTRRDPIGVILARPR